MATMTTPSETTTATVDKGPALVPYRLTVAQFDAMIGAGVFSDDARIELLGGVLSEKMTKMPPHTFVVNATAIRLQRILPERWLVRKEDPVVLADDWQPEPDIAVVDGPENRYRAAHPRAVDILLLIEAAESSYAVDRRVKYEGYAAAKVPCYWIVNLEARQIEVYTDPDGSGYRSTKIYGPDDAVPVVVDGREVGAIRVGDILP